MEARYAYLCNHCKCEDCSFPMCNHTTDVSYRLYPEGCEKTEIILIGVTNTTEFYMERVKPEYVVDH